jgi:serine phosphatase RsbU (regulator of sigma subunit)
MMTKFYIFAIILLAVNSLEAQINKSGLPELKNYTMTDYNGEEQNWSIVRDKRGVYYIGKTSEGVMEYDGTNWRKISIPNKSMIRALTVGDDGMVYVGAVGEIGRLKPDSTGTLKYESFMSLFRDSITRKSFTTDVWKAYAHGGNVYFSTRQYIALFDGDSVSTIDMGKSTKTANFFTFMIDGEIFIGSFWFGLHKLVGDTIQVVPNSEKLMKKNIFAMLNYNKDTTLIATGTSDFFLFNHKTNEFKPWTLKGKMADYIKSKGSTLYSGIKMANGNFGFGYVFGGKCSFIEVNRSGEILSLLNTEYGLNDESITLLFQESVENNEKPLVWLTLNNGIANIDLNSPLKKFDERSGFTGMIVDVIEFKGRLYVATMNGLYASDIDEMGVLVFKPVENIKVTTWNLIIFKDPKTNKEILLAGTHSINGGVYEVEGYHARRIYKEPEKHEPSLLVKKMYQSKHKKNRVYLALEGGFTWIEYENGGWITKNEAFKTTTLRGDFRSLVEDPDGTLWLGAYLKGIYKLKSFNPEDTLNLYGESRGMPKVCGHMIEQFNGKNYFGTNVGLFEYDEPTDQMKQTTDFDGVFNGRWVHRLIKIPGGYVFSDADENHKVVELIMKNSDGKWITNGYPFRVLPNSTTDALYAVGNTLYIGTSTTLYSYDLTDTLTYTRLSLEKESFDVLFRKIVAGDSVLNGGAFYQVENGKLIIKSEQPSGKIPHVNYGNNSITFEWSALWYLQPEKTLYSYKLEGFRDQWSAWSTEPKKDFTNLSEGNYTFRVKAKNVYGVESNMAKYSFKILPPWYRTIYAFIGYILLAIAVMVITIKIYTRRLIAEKERLERIVAERTAEVVAQKEEIEVQSEKIFHQNEHIKSSITYASKIQNAVLPPPETLTRMFGEYFILYLPRDIVSGDFYWMAEIRGLKYCAVADCTGHGVPGGFMSMMGISFLNQIIGQEKTLNAGEILNQLRANIIHSLHQTGKVGENKDGMDIALYIIDPKANKCQYSGANNPLILIRSEEAIVYKADKMPIGIYIKGDEPFTNTEIDLEQDDVIYTFSDGYVDQFGGPDKRKFMSKNFRELLLQIHKKPMVEQKEILNQTLLDWHGELDRVDDVVVMGYRHQDNSANYQ